MTPREYQKQAVKRLEAKPGGKDNWFVKALKQQHDSVSQQKQEPGSSRMPRFKKVLSVNGQSQPTTSSASTNKGSSENS